jgi:hypothetical protein
LPTAITFMRRSITGTPRNSTRKSTEARRPIGL